MTQIEKIESIYARLPPAARQEALDFLLFLGQRYGDGSVAAGQNVEHPAAPVQMDFEQASDYVLEKNAELYRRLA